MPRFSCAAPIALCPIERLYACDPRTARCEFLRDVGQPFNALAVAASGAFRSEQALIGATTEGRVFRLARDADPVEIGSLPSGCSGDLDFVGDRLLASIDREGGGDELVAFDPARTPTPTRLPGDRIYGLASCSNVVFAFDESGEIFTDVGDGFVAHARTEFAFWGASCRPTPPATSWSAPKPAVDASAEVNATPVSDADPPAEQPTVAIGCACS